MQAPKRVLCIMDISAVGRCSLSVVLPVMAACSVQACPLPMTLLPAHTGGFGEINKTDNSNFCSYSLEVFKRENIEFDAIYIGYLVGAAQFALAKEICRQYSSAYIMVDPAMGDGGKLYSSLPSETPQMMLELCSMAQLITPNLTESALLLGENAAENLGEATDGKNLQRRLTELSGEKRSVLITGVKQGTSHIYTVGTPPCGDDFLIKSERVPQSYPGTGDIFAAAVLGLLLGGLPLEAAVRKAMDFLSRAISATYSAGGSARHGVWFEPFLQLLK